MSIYEGIVIGTFIMVTIMMIRQYIDSEVPRVSDVIQLMNILPCYKIKVFKNGKRLRTIDLIEQINRPVKVHKMKDGILYIEIY